MNENYQLYKKVVDGIRWAITYDPDKGYKYTWGPDRAEAYLFSPDEKDSAPRVANSHWVLPDQEVNEPLVSLDIEEEDPPEEELPEKKMLPALRPLPPSIPMAVRYCPNCGIHLEGIEIRRRD